MIHDQDLYKLLSWAIWRYFEDGGETSLENIHDASRKIFENLRDRGDVIPTSTFPTNDWKFRYYKKKKKRSV